MGNFQTAEVFSDYMVLQRGKNIAIFGTGKNGTEIFGELGGFRTSCIVKNGKWKMIFPPMGAAKFMTIELSDGIYEDTIRFENVAIGEVWLAAGQSNMKFPLRLSKNGKTEIENLSDNVRFYSVANSSENDEKCAEWTTCADKTEAGNQSAAAYYFAKELSRCLGVTVGIISCCSEDMPISCFLDNIRIITEAKSFFDSIDSGVDYDNLKPLAATRENLILPISPYTLSGVLFYQGEADQNHHEAYYSLLTRLIQDWRGYFHNDELPFIIGQLAINGSESPNCESLCLIREAQMRVYNTVKNTGIAVLADCKEHSAAPDKETVGIRFARQALKLVYGGCDGAFSPMIHFAVWRGKTVELNFTNALGGFKVNGEPKGFEVCGNDGVFVPAFADISGEKIFISANGIERPNEVRYLWKNSSEVNITNGFGLPLAPFRISEF